MNRRTKIIVGVVSIFIIMLALIGITYGYFLTRVTGNTKDNSIFITTANLRLVYDDGTGEIRANNIQPGDTYYTKTFTVTNEGNAVSEYEVYLENVINNFVHEEDLLMFITCSSNIVGNTCDGYGDGSVSENTPTFNNSTYPIINSKLISNDIEPVNEQGVKEVHTYTLYLKFKDDGTDQSDDMGKTLQGKVQIYDPKDVVAISGTVNLTNAVENATYYVEIGEENKTSQIKSDGSYIVYGITTGTNELKVKYELGENTTTVLTKNITVSKGTTADVASDGSTITMTDLTSEVEIDIDLVNSTLTAGNIIETEESNLNGGEVQEVITNYTQEDIDNSNGTLMAAGETNHLNVIAKIENNTLIITKNGENSDGIMGNRNFYFQNQTYSTVIIENGVTNIGYNSFTYISLLENITIPKSVISIGRESLMGCSNLKTITYNGTIEEWNAITKIGEWDVSTGNYVVHCTNGDITKN